MYSLNVPVPTRVASAASEVARELPQARIRNRGEHTLGVKRLASDQNAQYSRIEAQTRELLRGQPPFEARISEIGVFENPPVGTAPVVHFVVESPELLALHDRLVERFGIVDEEIEGNNYSPHVTIARGGSREMAERVAGDIEPINWSVTELIFWDATHNQPVSTVSLPA
ncbi:2'-5' RNA ligase family protein [Halovenus halobia]|uniref:2'-5' RNA ligase family protein n=1 Tax=Halovenus halobia TaxID=3396622 RepID=UPI003F55F717